MNEGQSFDRHEDEIDLKELFMVLWNGKRIIIITTLVFAIIAALVTKFFIPPVYEAKLDLLVNFPETVSTKYGDYNLILNSNDQYINLFYANSVLNQTIQDMGYDAEKNTIEGFTKKLSINKDKESPNSFTIKVKSNTPKEALNLTNTLYKNYLVLINANTKLRSVEHFIDTNTIELSKYEESLNLNKDLLAQYKNQLASMSQTIDQNNLLEAVNPGTINYLMLDNLVNQNYKKVELDIINTEQTIFNLENKINITKRHLNELSIIKNDLLSNNGFSNDYLSAINRSIQLASQPVAPTQKVSPSTALNTVIAAVIGGMIAVIYVLLKKYWFFDEKVNNK